MAGKVTKSRRTKAVAMRRLYVIELDPAVLAIRAFHEANPQHRPGKPCVYVGSTGRDPQLRFEQHKAGFKANRFAKKYGLRLRQPMTNNQPPVPWRIAEAAERRLAERLRTRGYAVWQN